jgi:hypothetical protein
MYILLNVSDLNQRAIEILNRRQRPPRSSIKPAQSFPSLSRIPISDAESDLKGTPSIVGMKEWLDELGYSVLGCLSLCEQMLTL